MTDMDREAEVLLVAQVRDGDVAAFDQVYAEFNARLFSFLARLARRRDVAEDLPSPFDATVAHETGRRIEAALVELPAIYREALLLVAIEGMRPAEAAKVCGVTPEAMRQRISRARSAMARRLGDIEEALPIALKEVTT